MIMSRSNINKKGSSRNSKSRNKKRYYTGKHKNKVTVRYADGTRVELPNGYSYARTTNTVQDEKSCISRFIDWVFSI